MAVPVVVVVVVVGAIDSTEALRHQILKAARPAEKHKRI